MKQFIKLRHHQMYQFLME